MNALYCRIALPDDPALPLAGFYTRTTTPTAFGPAVGYVQLLWLRTAERSVVYLLADLLYFPPMLHRLVGDYFFQQYQIKDAAILAGGTHTHSGIDFGYFVGHDALEDTQRSLFQRLKQAIQRADWHPATLSYFAQTFEQPLSVGRRYPLRWPGRSRVIRAPRPGYPERELVTGLRIERAGAEPVILASYASHPVFDRGRARSGDYPGAVMQRLGDDTYWMLYQGFGGDLRPDYRTKRPRRGGAFAIVRSLLPVLLTGARFATYARYQYNDFVERLSRRLSSASRSTKTVRLQAIHAITLRLPSETGETSKTLHVRLHRFGQVFIVGIAAEVFYAYLSLLQQRYPDYEFIPLGCLSPCIGYLPTAADMLLGGYEVKEAPSWNGLDAPFDTAAITRVIEQLYALVDQSIRDQR